MNECCIDKYLTIEEALQALQLSLRENPQNLIQSEVHSEPDHLTLITEKKWTNGKALSVGFMGGSVALQKKVLAKAMQWSSYGNITFYPTSPSFADLRIDFKQDGTSWSYIGTDCLGIDKAKPTMNFGWLTDSSSDSEITRVVLHEFGHALGFVHEHQNPLSVIKWNKEQLYTDYAKQGWDKAQVDHNIINKYSKTITQFTAFDAASIMLYPILAKHTLDGFTVGLNKDLSSIDKQFMTQMYPKVPVVPPGSSVIETVIEVPRAGKYRLSLRELV